MQISNVCPSTGCDPVPVHGLGDFQAAEFASIGHSSSRLTPIHRDCNCRSRYNNRPHIPRVCLCHRVVAGDQPCPGLDQVSGVGEGLAVLGRSRVGGTADADLKRLPFYRCDPVPVHGLGDFQAAEFASIGSLQQSPYSHPPGLQLPKLVQQPSTYSPGLSLSPCSRRGSALSRT